MEENKRAVIIGSLVTLAFIALVTGINVVVELSNRSTSEELVIGHLEALLKQDYERLEIIFDKEDVIEIQEYIEVGKDNLIASSLNYVAETIDLSDDQLKELEEAIRASWQRLFSLAEYSVEFSGKVDEDYLVTVSYKEFENYLLFPSLWYEAIDDFWYEELNDQVLVDDGVIKIDDHLIIESYVEKLEKVVAEPIYGEDGSAVIHVSFNDKNSLFLNEDDLVDLLINRMFPFY